jgi:hypothetical protein
MARSSTSCLHMSWVDLRLLPGVARPCRAGVPNAEPGGGRAAVPRSGAALDIHMAKFGSASAMRRPLLTISTAPSTIRASCTDGMGYRTDSTR